MVCGDTAANRGVRDCFIRCSSWRVISGRRSIFTFVVLFVPLWFYKVVAFKCVSFTVTDATLTVNSGILIKSSNAISFAQIQNISNTKGPLAAMLGLSKMNVWTASPSQIRVTKGETEHKPTGMLWLETTNAEWMKNFILEKQAK